MGGWVQGKMARRKEGLIVGMRRYLFILSLIPQGFTEFLLAVLSWVLWELLGHVRLEVCLTQGLLS